MAGEINYAKNLPRVAKVPDLDGRFQCCHEWRGSCRNRRFEDENSEHLP